MVINYYTVAQQELTFLQGVVVLAILILLVIVLLPPK